MLKKVCSFIVAAAIGCSSLWCAAGAASSNINEAAFALSSLGVIQGDENGALNLNEQMTRAEFAKIITMLKGSETIAQGFTFADMADVPSDNWACGYIGYCVQAGLMQGDGDGYFRPDDNITLEECVKTVVVLLGYEVAAAERGGYPVGYYNIAVEKGLLKSVSGNRSEAAIRQDIVMLVYNALDVPMLVSTYSEDASYKEDPNQTLRSLLESMKDMLTYTGIVTANFNTWLNTPIDNMTETQIEIDGVLFETQVANAGDYIGQEVRVYYQENDSMRHPLIYNIEPTSRNTKTVLDNRDVVEISQTAVKYWKADKERTLSLENDALLVYNNRVETKILSEFAELTEGEMILIDNDGNNRIDYVFIEDYKNYIVDNAAKNGNLKLKYYAFEDGKEMPKYRHIQIDFSQENSYTVEDAEGNRLNYEDIESGDVVSVFENNTDSFVRIIVTKESTVSGKVVFIGKDNDIRLDGSEELYHVANDALAENLQMGESYRFSLNFRGDIVYAEDDDSVESNWKYGYINATAEKTFETVSIQLITAGQVENREEVDQADRTNKDTVPVTLCSNDSIQTIVQTEKLSADGGRIKPEVLLEKEHKSPYVGVPIRYMLSSTGQLSRIETLEYAAGNSEMQYNAKEKVFAKKSGLSSAAFLIDENTRVICIPTNADASQTDMMTRVSVDNKDVLLRYNANGYELDEETGAVKLMVLRTEMKASAVGTVEENSAKMGLIESAALSVDEDGEEYLTLTMITGSEVKEMKTLPLSDGREGLRSLRSGDFIFYSDDADGNLEAAVVSENMNDISYPYYEGEQSLSERAAGYAADLRLNKLDAENLRKVHELELIRNTDGDTKTFLIPVSNYPDIFIYDLRRQTVEAGTLDDIVPYATITDDAEKVFLVQPKGALRALVIIR